MKKSIKFFLVVVSLCFVQESLAKIWLPSILSDNMVLQQNSEVTIWGWTTHTSEKITVIGSWDNEGVTTEAYQGTWSLKIKTPKSGGPFTLKIEGHEAIEIQNVLIGEVWIASGQSNMQWTPTNGLLNAEEEIKNANFPNIRFFQVDQHTAKFPQENTPGKWMECTPETMKDFSSVAYFFARNIQDRLSFPMGMISSNWGGTPIETWIPSELINGDMELKKAATKVEEKPWWPNDAGLAYNAMIHPLSKFNIAGCIWYQGESNRQNPNSYYKSFPLLIKSWRDLWRKDFSFYFAQIAPFKYGKMDAIDAAIVRDAQLTTMLHVPKTGMAVTSDIGNLENIHPINKQEVGKRLALWALVNDYGIRKLVESGPIYKSMKINRNKIILSFDHANNGLIKKGKKLTNFKVAGTDKVFYSAKAKIEGNTIVVYAKNVKNPKAVRFAFTDTAEPNLYNTEGLPVPAFRTDSWKFE
ncbi:sialate O-acetylesterase [Maribacter sp. HTCC2170]|uniref:sialate O-acetylesterase n=1 Tax=Maribacter sp. (strain HTCC2170 / KCCM 42371) TaxID=313603 RepID=UPI00006BD560|nr:sialate O-acetylesterase [Maribacter sp. HTCC2170]EAR02042.1 sialic acid-specific 9-O-acetylesterase [Maribacter sp. HTCC2170]